MTLDSIAKLQAAAIDLDRIANTDEPQDFVDVLAEIAAELREIVRKEEAQP